MERLILKVNDVTIANACISFAETLGLSTSSNIWDIDNNNYLTTGSKNNDVDWIKNESFADKKADEADIDIYDLEDNVIAFITTCIDAYNDYNGDDEITLNDEQLSPDNDTIIALFNKVKAQKKSPSRYYVIYKNDAWIASTISDNSYGNLSILMSDIS
jgi:hypothetical protein